MPMYDFKCAECDKVFERLCPVGTDRVLCGCEAEGWAEKVWISAPPAVIGDACDIIQENGFREPRHFTSKSDRLRALKEAGLSEFVRHTGVPGTDKSPHTTRWSSMSQRTLDDARLMLERVGGVRPVEPTEEEVDRAVEVGEVDVPIVLSGGRSINLRLGNMYSGVLDPSILKKE